MPLPPAGVPHGLPTDLREELASGYSVQALPIEVGGQQVGTLMVSFQSGMFDESWREGERRIFQGVLSAMLGLAAILFGLATLFAGRISTPLRRITAAAQRLSAGDMQVRVPRHMVREIDELSGTFNRMADALVSADQQRRQLTADVAHELRTPLSIIKGRLEGIQDGIYTADDEQIDGLLDEVALLERLIEDLRLLALAEAGQLPLFPEPVDAARLLADTRRSFAQQAEERGVQLVLTVSAPLPDLTADPQRLAQVLGNLVSNALRYTSAGGAVTLRATAVTQVVPGREEAPAVEFAVSDTGKGIATADLPHIFDRFWRADRARTRSSGGAGLGLAITRRIVEAHHGQIWAESEIGKGTTISFVIPAEGGSGGRYCAGAQSGIVWRYEQTCRRDISLAPPSMYWGAKSARSHEERRQRYVRTGSATFKNRGGETPHLFLTRPQQDRRRG
ncbi:HAMP domain-containing protein [Candidatus Gracilibacteria bacterium]|nr:HAMP domain-containing protein [Candidatus Gracilibacteria bacterium]